MSYPVAARALLRDTLIDAAGELLRERTWSQVTMAEVARAAGVSRQTVYNEFGDRKGLAQAYVLREGDRLVGEAERAIAAHPEDPHRAFEAAFEGFLVAAADHPLLAAIARGEDTGLLALVTTEGEPVVSFAAARLATTLVEGWPRIDPGDARTLAETVVRLAISHAALPTAPPARAARALAHVLGPFFAQALAARRRAA